MKSYLVLNLPFYGLWIDLCFDYKQIWYEAIVCHQESNQIFYNLVYSTSQQINVSECNETVAIVNSESNPLTFEIDTNRLLCFNRGQLNEDRSVLTFIDSKDTKNSNLYKKVTPKCGNCDSEMLFMRKQMVPSHDIISGQICCNLHKDYYQRNDSMDPSLRCSSFNAFHYENEYNIETVSFYFCCIQCQDFYICAGYVYFIPIFYHLMSSVLCRCALIKMEQEYKNENMPKCKSIPLTIHKFEQPKRKRIKLESTEKKPNKSQIGQKRKIEEIDLSVVYIENENIENVNANKTDYKQLYLKEAQLNKTLSLELKQANEEKTKWKEKYDKLYSNMKRILHKDINQVTIQK